MVCHFLHIYIIYIIHTHTHTPTHVSIYKEKATPCPYDAVAAAAAKLLQSCPTLCDPIDGSPPGSPIPGILQTRTLEWVAISFSNAWKWKVKVKLLSCVRLLVTPRTAAYQAPPSMGLSRQEYLCGLPLPSPCLYRYTYIKMVADSFAPCFFPLHIHSQRWFSFFSIILL